MSNARVLPLIGAMLVAASTVSAITVGSAPAAASVPSTTVHAATGDFATVMGYQPTIEAGVPVKPNGDCSSPVPLPMEFLQACRAHDLGYDELRYATRVGTHLPASFRRHLDDALDARMHASCATRTDRLAGLRCTTMATVAANFVRANSLREGYGSPR